MCILEVWGPERKLRTNLRMTCKIYSLLNWPAPFSGPRPKLNCPGGPNRPRPPPSSFLNSAPQRKAREGFHRRLSRRVRRRAVSLVPNSKSLPRGPLAHPVPSLPGAWPPRRSRRTRRPRPGALKERPTGSGATNMEREAQEAAAAGRSGRRRRSSSTATTVTTTATG